MRIWLDDDPKYEVGGEFISTRPAPPGFTHVHNLAELKQLLAERPDELIEVMSFDHDLGDGEPDGYEIIKWLVCEHAERYPDEVRVHSANGPCAANIEGHDVFVRRRHPIISTR